MVTIKVPSCPTMLVGYSGVGDRGEKGEVVVFINGLLDVNDGFVKMVDVRGIDGGNEFEGHLAMVCAIPFLAEVRVFKGVVVGGVNSSSWFELVVFEGSEDCWIALDECPEAGRGHDGGRPLS